MARLGGNPGVDHDALHEYLWRKSDHRNVAHFVSRRLAEQLDLTEVSLSRTLREMSLAGRITRVGRGKWKVKDPAVWGWSDPAWAERARFQS